MLVRLMYTSRATQSVTQDTLHAILKTAKTYNLAAGITGVLCFCNNGRVFLQALEGGRDAVSKLYGHIVRDERHSDVTLLNYDEIAERQFGGWSMGQVNMSRLNPSLLLKYSESAVMDPYAMPGKASQALLLDLVATASIMGNG